MPDPARTNRTPWWVTPSPGVHVRGPGVRCPRVPPACGRSRTATFGRYAEISPGSSLFGGYVQAPAGTGLGAVFNLGQSNSVDALSRLVGATTGPLLRVDNSGSGYALQPLAEPNKPPLVVSADAGKAVNLSADELDNKDSTAFFTGDTYRTTKRVQGVPAPGSNQSYVQCDGPEDGALGGGYSHNRGQRVRGPRGRDRGLGVPVAVQQPHDGRVGHGGSLRRLPADSRPVRPIGASLARPPRPGAPCRSRLADGQRWAV